MFGTHSKPISAVSVVGQYNLIQFDFGRIFLAWCESARMEAELALIEPSRRESVKKKKTKTKQKGLDAAPTRRQPCWMLHPASDSSVEPSQL